MKVEERQPGNALPPLEITSWDMISASNPPKNCKSTVVAVPNNFCQTVSPTQSPTDPPTRWPTKRPTPSPTTRETCLRTTACKAKFNGFYTLSGQHLWHGQRPSYADGNVKREIYFVDNGSEESVWVLASTDRSVGAADMVCDRIIVENKIREILLQDYLMIGEQFVNGRIEAPLGTLPWDLISRSKKESCEMTVQAVDTRFCVTTIPTNKPTFFVSCKMKICQVLTYFFFLLPPSRPNFVH